MRSRVVQPALRPYVAAMVGYHEVMDRRAVHHGLPAPTLTVVLSFDDPLDAAWLHDPDDRSRFWACAAGLHTAPALIRTHGRQHGIQLALTPGGARALLGVPAGILGATMAHHDDLPLGVDDSLLARLAAQRGWDQRFDLLEEALLEALGRGEDPRHVVAAEVREAWRLLRVSGGRTAVADLADHVGWSRRRLLRDFRAELGVSPKQAGRVIRFDRARGLADSGLSLADTAAECGFSDQAHLTREWVALAGRTPTQLPAASYHVA